LDRSIKTGTVAVRWQPVRGSDGPPFHKLGQYQKRNGKNHFSLCYYEVKPWEGSVHFESTGSYSNYLKEFCWVNRIKACIVNPKKSANFAKVIGNRSKTDKIDAMTLYKFKTVIRPEDILIPRVDKVSEELSAYVSSYEFALKRANALSNHIEALRYNPNAPKDLLVSLKKELRQAKKLREEIGLQMEEYIEKNDDLRENYRNLLTIVGIGKISAISLLSLFRTYKDTNRSQITALVGLDPTRKESGTSLKGRRKISKSGDATIPRILYFPTLTAIRYNKKIKSVHDRLVDNHKSKKLAIIAAMRKLVLVAHAIYKNKTVFCAA